MTKRLSIATAVLTMLAALLALVLVAATPALAHHKDDHEQGGKPASSSTEDAGDKDGDADSDPNTAYTEDNDTNDGNTPNNVSDEGDNAHPSGKDRSVENGGSGNQGKSESNPDDSKGPMRSEGEPGDDKPNGPGGTDLADQDGNNGCGNDDDFDDDNNGWCGKPEKEEETKPDVVVHPPLPTCPEIMGSQAACEPVVEPNIDHTCPDEEMVGGAFSCEKPVVLGEIITRGEPAEVLGSTVSPAPAARAAGAVLPFTGVSVTVFLIIALGLLGVGFALMRTRSTK
jgi:hypothetical protein